MTRGEFRRILRRGLRQTTATVAFWLAIATVFAGISVADELPVEAVDVQSLPVEVRDEIVPRSPLDGPRLAQQLDASIPGANWENAPLRSVVGQLSDAYDVAVVCDRRLDPTAKLTLDVSNAPLRQILAEIAGHVGGEVRFVGNTAYLGPPDATGVVRTLAELRRRELKSGSSRAGRRAADLLRPRTVGWTDLTEPAVILEDVADRFRLKIENPEAISHDLWTGSVLPEMDAADMLTLVLVPFDLTFEWSDDFASIRLVPLPADRSRIGVEQMYPPFRQLDETLADWKDAGKPFESRPAGRNIVVRGPLELHEQIDAARLGRGERGGVSPPSRTNERDNMDGAVPLTRRQFTLTVSQVPASAIMKKLEESGIKFEYDAGVLKDAGVDLNKLVSIDVKQAKADAFLKALFEPLGVKTTVRGVTVRLMPAE